MPYHLSKTSPDDYPCIPPSLFMDFPARITCESKPCVSAALTACCGIRRSQFSSQHHPSLVNQQQLLRQYGCLGGADLMPQECTQNLFFGRLKAEMRVLPNPTSASSPKSCRKCLPCKANSGFIGHSLLLRCFPSTHQFQVSRSGMSALQYLNHPTKNSVLCF